MQFEMLELVQVTLLNNFPVNNMFIFFLFICLFMLSSNVHRIQIQKVYFTCLHNIYL